MDNVSFVYTTYIATTPEKLWQALTNGEFTKQYWFGSEMVSDGDWQVGSGFKLINKNKEKIDHFGEVLVCEPNRLLTISWSVRDIEGDRVSKVTYEITPLTSTVKLTVRHDDLIAKDIKEDTGKIDSFNTGWPFIISNLKSLLETGKILEAY